VDLIPERCVVKSVLVFLCSIVQFYLKFGCSQRSNLSSSSEPVLLRYSTDGGIHWKLVGRYDVQAFATPTYVVLKIPYEAKTNATRMHWWQPRADDSQRADWAIDQVNKVFVTCGYIFMLPLLIGVLEALRFRSSVPHTMLLNLGYRWS